MPFSIEEVSVAVAQTPLAPAALLLWRFGGWTATATEQDVDEVEDDDDADSGVGEREESLT